MGLVLRPRTAWLGAAAAALAFLLALAAPAPAQVQDYRTNDYGGFRNILPPGQGQTVNAAEALAFAGGTLPAHYDDQREMYGDLVFATPGLAASEIDQYFKDGSFGVAPGQQEGAPYSPGSRAGLTVIRDSFGVPHIYGATRDDVMFGAGYVGAEDRLFFMDVLRNAGRAKLSSFAGPSNRAMDAEQWDVAPYREEDLQRQIDLAEEVYGAEGARLQQDLAAYVDGINQYIDEAKADPVNKMPAEYAAINKPPPLNPVEWKGTDVIATASLIGGIFGKGGGGEVGNAEIYSAAKARFGEAPGKAAWADFRQANDPEAPTTVHGQSFPYQDRPATQPESNPAVAIPDPGSLQPGSPDDASSGGLGGLIGGLLGGLGDLPGGSNALLVSGQESDSGHPLAVFGPQVAYFAPEILMEQDMHGPDIDARGATFTGVNLYVLLGRGQDFAWSATSAGQDIIDTFAEELCEPGGGTPTVDSMHYMWRGECRPMEVLENNQITNPNPGDPGDPPGVPQPFNLEAHRTVHGVVSHRGTVDGDPVAFAKLRSTYFHEADSARAFSALNQPSRVDSAQDFQRVMNDINFTFNWFYADDRDIAYFNSGANPVRAAGTDPEFPTWGTGEYDWQGWDPVVDPDAGDLSGGTNFADYTPFNEHPQVVNQSYLTSWNNKQAPGYRSAEAQYGFSAHYRSQPLDDRIEDGIIGGQTMSLHELIDAMGDAGTVDLRGDKVLPLMLDVIREGPGGVPADLSDEVAILEAWTQSGAHRRDRDQSGAYDHSAAVQLMDAWWDPPGDPLDPMSGALEGALEAAFRDSLGDDLFRKVRSQLAYDNPPNNRGGHLGSAYQDGWWGQFSKDLRSILGEPVPGAHSRRYCGAPDKDTEGTLASCHDVLVDSLTDAAAIPAATLYQDPDCSDGDQMCFDEVRFRTVGAVSVDPIHWINRPTWQQVVEIQGHRPRSGASAGAAAACANRIAGTRAADRLFGTPLGDLIRGGRGRDRLSGLEGDDCLLGQRGNDRRLDGGGGADTVRGGPGRDRLIGGPGPDILRGGSGDDVIDARDGEVDRIFCGKGDDRVKADPVDQLSKSCE